MKKKYNNILLLLTSIILILILTILYTHRNLNERNLLFIIIIIQSISLLSIIKKKIYIYSIISKLFGISLFLGIILFENIHIIILCILILLIALITRIKYKFCLYYQKRSSIIIYRINNIIYISLILIYTYKLINHKHFLNKNFLSSLNFKTLL